MTAYNFWLEYRQYIDYLIILGVVNATMLTCIAIYTFFKKG